MQAAWPQAAGDAEPVIVSSMKRPSESRPAPADGSGFLEAAATVYEAGADLSFEGLFSGETRRRVALPGYPFQRQRHWVEPPRRSKRPDGHPLLGVRHDSPRGETLFETEILPTAPAWLDDHRVYGRMVVPGALYGSMAAAAHGEFTADRSLAVEDLQLHSPMIPRRTRFAGHRRAERRSVRHRRSDRRPTGHHRRGSGVGRDRPRCFTRSREPSGAISARQPRRESSQPAYRDAARLPRRGDVSPVRDLQPVRRRGRMDPARRGHGVIEHRLPAEHRTAGPRGAQNGTRRSRPRRVLPGPSRRESRSRRFVPYVALAVGPRRGSPGRGGPGRRCGTAEEGGCTRFC